MSNKIDMDIAMCELDDKGTTSHKHAVWVLNNQTPIGGIIKLHVDNLIGKYGKQVTLQALQNYINHMEQENEKVS